MANVIWLDYNDAPEQHGETPSDTEALRRGLLDRLEAVLLYLSPRGRIGGGRFYVGDVDGNPGKSLAVELDGERRGLWKDFATDEGGDVIDLWARSRGLSARHDFPRLADEIRYWLGLAPPTGRAAKSNIRGAPVDELGPYTAKWDYLAADGRLIACVYRFDPPTGKEYRPWDVRARMWHAPDPRPIYNLPAVAKAREVVLVEGEKDASALIDVGITATTAMNGARAPPSSP
jgi:DNA primase